jgi:hypothetical protein
MRLQRNGIEGRYYNNKSSVVVGKELSLEPVVYEKSALCLYRPIRRFDMFTCRHYAFLNKILAFQVFGKARPWNSINDTRAQDAIKHCDSFLAVLEA